MHPRARKRENLLKKWYDSIPVGKFSGNPPELQLVGPDLWVHFPRPAFPFKFIRANGEEITPGMFSLDGGSIPVGVRGFPYMSKWHYGFAYILHDWMWHLHQSNPAYYTTTMEETNHVLMESIKTLQIDGFCHHDFEGGAFTLRNIWRGVNSRVAKNGWEAHYA